MAAHLSPLAPGGWLLALCLLDDMLPLAAVAAQVLLPDNTRGVVLASMWIMLLYAITVIPRAIYLVFYAVESPADMARRR